MCSYLSLRYAPFLYKSLLCQKCNVFIIITIINIELWSGTSSNSAIFALDCFDYLISFVICYEFEDLFSILAKNELVMLIGIALCP